MKVQHLIRTCVRERVWGQAYQSTKNLSNWVFNFLLSLLEKPLSIIPGHWTIKTKEGCRDGAPQAMPGVSTSEEIFRNIAMNTSKILMSFHQTSYKRRPS